MTNRLAAILCACAAVILVVVLVQTVRFWNAEAADKASSIAAAPEKETRKAPASKPKTGRDDDRWNPAAGSSRKGKGARAVADANSETADGTSAAGGTDTALSSAADAGQKGDKNAGTAGKPKDAKAAGAGAATGKDGKPSDAAISPEAVARSEQLAKAAQDLFNKGDFEHAREKVVQSLQENPKNGAAWRQLTSVEKQLGNSEGELAAFDQWTSELPGDKMGRYEAAAAYARNGMPDQALQHLSAFEALSRGDPQSNGMASIVYGAMNMTEEQGAALSQYVNAQPTSMDAHRMLGEYYQRTGQTDAAFGEYQTMAQLDPRSTAPLMQMGNAYVQMGQFDNALTQFEAAARVNPKDAEALSRMAYMQRQLGDMQGAVTTYQRVVNLDPNSVTGVQAAQHMQYIQGEMSVPAQ